MQRKQVIFLLLIGLLPIALATVTTVSNSSMTTGPAQTIAQASAGSMTGQAGNITELNITHRSQTSQWQGIYGSLSVNLLLQDATGNVFYNWSTGNVTSGEVYFSRYSDINFGNINDPTTNFVTFVQTDYGMANTTTFENLTSTFVDGAHAAFMVGSINIPSPTPRVLTYNSTGGQQFTTVILREGGLNRDAYAALVNADARAFNNLTVDFQALLPMNTTATTTVYYVYAELQ